MFVEITYICTKCGNIFPVFTSQQLQEQPTLLVVPEIQVSPQECPQCCSAAVEILEENLIKRHKKNKKLCT